MSKKATVMLSYPNAFKNFISVLILCQPEVLFFHMLSCYANYVYLRCHNTPLLTPDLIYPLALFFSKQPLRKLQSHLPPQPQVLITTKWHQVLLLQCPNSQAPSLNLPSLNKRPSDSRQAQFNFLNSLLLIGCDKRYLNTAYLKCIFPSCSN